MRSCPNCQSPNPDNAAVCDQCGVALVAYPTQQYAQAAQVTPNSPVPGQPLVQPSPGVQAAGPLKRSLRKAGVGAVVLLLLAFLGAAFVGGWTVHGLLQTYLSGEETTASSENTTAAAAVQRAMPDIRGLQVADAKQILADTGVDVAQLQLQERPWGGPAGLVITQNPVVGEAATGPITLTVSTPAAMPDLTGRTRQEALEALRALGVEASVSEEYALAKPTGTVLRSSVKPGDPLPLDVQLVVAQAGGSVFLSSIDPVSSSCATGEYKVNGISYEDSLSCAAGRDKPNTYNWQVSGKAMYLEGSVGVADSETAGARVTVTVVGDGRVLGDLPATVGAPARLGIDITGVQRLELRVQGTAKSAVLAEARLKGTVAQVQQLEDD